MLPPASLSPQIHLDFPGSRYRRLWFSLFLIFPIPLILHPSLPLSLLPSITLSICVSGLFSLEDWSCVFFSKKKVLVSPWGKIVLSGPQTCSLSPYLSPPPFNCLATALRQTPLTSSFLCCSLIPSLSAQPPRMPTCSSSLSPLWLRSLSSIPCGHPD